MTIASNDTSGQLIHKNVVWKCCRRQRLDGHALQWLGQTANTKSDPKKASHTVFTDRSDTHMWTTRRALSVTYINSRIHEITNFRWHRGEWLANSRTIIDYFEKKRVYALLRTVQQPYTRTLGGQHKKSVAVMDHIIVTSEVRDIIVVRHYPNVKLNSGT